MMFWLKGCVRCGGDLFVQYEDWQCFQCGRYYYDTMPASYRSRREGVWGNSGRRRRKGSKSASGVPSV